MGAYHLALSLLLAPCLTACDDAVVDVRALESSEILQVNVVEDSIVGDGLSYTTVEVTTHPSASESTAVSLTTTAGTFLNHTDEEPRAISVIPRNGSAWAVLVSEENTTDRRIAIVEGLLGNVRASDQFVLYRPQPDITIAMALSETELYADGVSNLVATAKIEGRELPDGTTVTFKIVGAGEIVGMVAETKSKNEKLFRNKASVMVTGGATVGQASILVTVGNISTRKSFPIRSPVSAVTLRVPDDELSDFEANGVSRMLATATFTGNGSLPDNSDVMFQIHGAQIVGTDAKDKQLPVKSLGGKASVTVVSTTMAGKVTLVVSHGSISDRKTYEVRAALPTAISLTSSAAEATADGKAMINITAALLREPGRGSVSDGTIVEFIVTKGGQAVPVLSGSRAVGTDHKAMIALSTQEAGVYKVEAKVGSFTSVESLSVEFKAS